MYTGELKVGAVYCSHDPKVTRRIERLTNNCVYYVYRQEGRSPKHDVGMVEELFRQFTSHEVPPENVQ